MRKSFNESVSVEEVCRRYLAGESIPSLAETFSVCVWTICDRLKRGGVKARTNTENAGITAEMESGMVAAYVSGKTSYEVADKFGVGQNAVWGALQRAGVRSRGLSHPTHSINEDFWYVDSPERDYWLGFSMADGCVTDRGKRGLAFSIGLADVDCEHIAKFNLATQSTYPVRSSRRNDTDGCKRMGTCSVSVFSKKFCDGAISVGIVPRKTYCADVEDRFLTTSFFRGLMDGDGSVGIASNKTGRPIITFVGHENSKLTDKFFEFCNQNGVISARIKVGPKRNTNQVLVLGPQAVRLARILYADAPKHLRLDRKYEAWEKIEELVDWKSKNCKSGSGYGFYAPVWSEEQKATAKASMKSAYKASGTVPPSRSGIKKNSVLA